MPIRAHRRATSAWINLPLRAKGLVVVTIPVLTLLVATAAFSLSGRWSTEVEDSRHHHATMQILLHQLADHTSEAQSSTIAYVFAVNESILPRQQEAIEAARKVIRQLNELPDHGPGHGPDHQAKVSQTASLVETELQALTVWANETRARFAVGPAVAAVQVRRVVMQQLRQEIGAMLEVEQEHLAAASARVAHTRTLAQNTVAAATLLGVLGGLAAALLFSSGVVRRVDILAENARRIGQGEPLLHVDLGEDEIGRLSRVADETAVRLIERENALRESEERYRGLVDMSPDPIVVHGGGVLLYANAAARRMVGASSAGEVVGRPMLQFVHPDSRRLVAERVSRMVTESVGVPVAEERILRLDGTVVDVETAAAPVVFQGQGAIQVVMREISERKRAEAEIRRQTERAETLVRTAALINNQLDLETVLNAVCAEACRVFQVPAASVELLAEGRQVVFPASGGESVPICGPAAQPLPSIVAVDMVHGGRPLGQLKVFANLERPCFDSGELALLRGLADQAAQAIANARLFQENQHRVEALSSLYSAAWQVAQSLDPRELAAKVCQVLVEQRGLQGAWLGQADPGGLVRVVHSENVPNGYLNQHEIRWDDSTLGHGPVGRAVRSGEPRTAQDIANDDTIAPWREALLGLGYRSAAALPLVNRNTVFGTLTVYAKTTGFFTPEVLDFLQAYANLAAAALTNARLFAESQRRLRHTQAQWTIGMALTAHLDQQETLAIVLKEGATLLGVDANAMLLANPATGQLEYAAGQGLRTEAMSQVRVLCPGIFPGRAMAESAVVVVKDLATEPGVIRRDQMLAEGFISYVGIPFAAKGRVQGVLELYSRSRLEPDEEWLELAQTLAGQAAVAVDNARLFADLQQSNAELVAAYDRSLQGWSRALDLRDHETEGHTERVTEYTLRLAGALGVPEGDRVHLRRGALLHDIGKIGIPDSILLKPGPLSPEEWTVMKRHPAVAFEWLSPIGFLRPALDIPYCHHERWDGTGYPRGLKGEDIPLSARIFAVVDVWDALRSERPYRGAWTEGAVREYIAAGAGSQFDPHIVQVFLNMNW